MRITVHPSIFVFAESVTNDMNMDKNNRKLKAKTMRRRILASVCAVAIALLQIAVIGTIGTEEVYAKTLNITVDYSDKTGITGSVDTDSANKNGSRTFQYTVEEPDPETGDPKTVNKSVTLRGATISDILGKAGIGETGVKSVTIDGQDFGSGNLGKVFVVSEISGDPLPEGVQVKNKLCTNSDTLDSINSKGEVGSMIVDKGDTKAVTVEITNAPASIKEGESFTLKAKVTADDFYKKGRDVSVTWSASPTSVATIGAKTGKLTGKKSGDVSVTATADGIKSSAKKIKVTKKETKSIQNATITLSKTYYIYDGKAKKPSVTVKYGGTKLKKGTDYTVSYSNNIGSKNSTTTAIVTIKGKGKYTGKVNKTFTIGRKSSSSSHTTGKYTTYRARTGSSNTATSTGTTAPIQTYAPDRTITVKEVFLGQQIQEDPVEQPTPADMMEDGWDDMNEDTSDQWAEDEYNDIEFGPMAGSAAVAVAACGAGAVGRIRRFKVDTAAEAVKSIIKRG